MENNTERNQSKKTEIILLAILIILICIDFKLAVLFIVALCAYAVYKYKKETSNKDDDE